MSKMDIAIPGATIPVATPTAVVPLPPLVYVPSITVEYPSPQEKNIEMHYRRRHDNNERKKTRKTRTISFRPRGNKLRKVRSSCLLSRTLELRRRTLLRPWQKPSFQLRRPPYLTWLSTFYKAYPHITLGRPLPRPLSRRPLTPSKLQLKSAARCRLIAREKFARKSWSNRPLMARQRLRVACSRRKETPPNARWVTRPW